MIHDDTYKSTVRKLSDRLVEAQRPIRILDAIKWDADIQEKFFKKKAQEQPEVDGDYYAKHPLSFDPKEKKLEFHTIERDTIKQLGQFSPIGQIMRRMCREYQMTVDMIAARGQPQFSELSQELYGSANDVFHAGDPTLADLSVMMSSMLEHINLKALPADPKTISGEEAVNLLSERLKNRFGAADKVRVILSDGIIADAAAGSDYIKIKRDAYFSERELRQLEIHEGWVHVGTTLNGLAQPYCTFLSKGPPSSTITQEGLAIVTEITSFVSYPERVKRITDRIRAIHMAEDGATFLDVYAFFLKQENSEVDSYAHTSRVFRGSTPTGKPFTKDLAYSKGFILLYNFIRLAVKRGMVSRLPLLFCGKSTLEDVRVLANLVEEGLVIPPKILPPQFEDLNALTAWMCYSNFLNQLNLKRIEADYMNIL